MQLKGGMAHVDGVTFLSNSFTATAKRNKNGSISTSVRARTTKGMLGLLQAVPLVRGLTILTAVFQSRLALVLISLGTLSWLVDMFYQSDYTGPVSDLLTIIMVLGFVYLIKKKIGYYHGAEHKVFNALRRGRELTMENVKAESCISKYCGSNLFIIFLVLNIALELLLFQLIDDILLSLISFILAYEIVRFGRDRQKLSWLFWPGGLLQQYVLTKEPSVRELEVAIMCATLLEQKEAEKKEEII